MFRIVDLDASLSFYTEVLGAGVEKIQDGIGLYQLRGASSLIDLYRWTGPGGPGGRRRAAPRRTQR